jgi:ABC-2 type transport system ATP-binding protein
MTLQVNAVRKTYGSLVAVDGVSFSAAAGETIGLLGPNGAGKTTTVSMIAGLTRPDSGEVLIEGKPVRSDTDPVKLRIGLVPQELALYEELPALENLRLFAALYGIDGARADKAIAAALELVGLSDRVKDKPSTFSGGMKRRLNLAAALLHDPQILLLDEPTVGVDPQSRNAIFENLETLKSQGKTLVYTTHYMEEAERLCDRLVVIDHGKVIANDTLHGLYAMLPVTNLLSVELAGDPALASLDQIRAIESVKSASLENQTLRIGVHDLADGAPEVLRWLSARGLAYTHIATERPDLETVFLSLTGRRLRD